MKNMIIENLSDTLDSAGEISYKENTSLNRIYYQISKKIIGYRKVNKLSQKKLAGILGVGQSMVSKLESGEYNPTIEQLWKISHKLGWKFDIIINIMDEEKMNSNPLIISSKTGQFIGDFYTQPDFTQYVPNNYNAESNLIKAVGF